MLPSLQSFLPQHWLTAFAGLLANCQIPWLKNKLIQYFIRRYPVNLEESIKSDPFSYGSFNEFFTRALLPHTRPIASGLHDLASPADGQISQFGQIEQNQLFQAKGHYFTIESLLGGDTKQAEPFINGTFLTIYLAPENYHRVHMPIDGTLSKMIYIPGRLFSVNLETSAAISNLFARNERVVTFFDTSIGKVAIILVGAMIVGSIETIWAGTITSPRKNCQQVYDYREPIYLKRGEELGKFKLGSTVIVLFERDMVSWDPYVTASYPIKMGERLGIFKPDRW